ncbi:MAG TPA: RimK family alpha-L-glutamate ligase [Candidatus Woesearchaeota archaeon]|nr:RimK family alpha-L-glutamate ligase [Candidatus Woesearchaeota archaeon]
MKCAVISLGSTSSEWACKELGKFFDSVDSLNIKELQVSLDREGWKVFYEGKEIVTKYDAVFLKGSFRYAVTLRALAHAFAESSYMPLRPESFDIGHDKILTHLVLQKWGVAMPKTYLFSKVASAKKFVETSDYPLIVKIPNGTQGKGVIYLDSLATATSILDTLSHLKQPFFIQEYIESSGVDYRLLVIGDEVYGYKRVAKKGEKRANIHAGATTEKLEISTELKSLAVRTVRAINADICAVDVIPSTRGSLVIEVNLSPGLQGITKATGINIASRLAEYIYKKSILFKEQSKKDQPNVLTDLGIDLSDKTNEEKGKVISELEFKGDRILLPGFVSKIGKFKPCYDYEFDISDEQVFIRRASK